MSNSDISISTSNSYISRLKNALSASINVKSWVNTEIGVSYSILLNRLWKDKTDPRRRKKKKAGFKLGEGSIQVLESVFYQQTLDEAVGPIPEIPVPEKPAEGAEVTENPPAEVEIPDKEYKLEPCNVQWYKLALQAQINVIFNTIVSEKRRPKVAKGVRDTNPI
jgi:hypothetical protein